MRCISCNCELTDREATRKYKSTQEFLDLCDSCFSEISDEVETIDNPALANTLDHHEWDEYED